MCGRITLDNMSWAEFRDWLTLSRAPETAIPSRYNVAPTGSVPIIRPGPDGLEGAVARWWFIPGWFRGNLSEWKASTFNARAEDLARKPAFRDAYRHGRCAVLASGYYEWQQRDGSKHPHYIHPAGNAPALIMAGLCSEAHLPDWQGLTCTVLTEAARGAMGAIHDRMPLMLEPDGLHLWLAGAAAENLPRLPLGALAWHEVSRAVNAVRNDDESLIEPIEG
ncbi:MAG: SOS response-associated peptidase [Bacteroidales bacterium]|nr:SOS response-associated peptidase [Bacteroidales bacterium]